MWLFVDWDVCLFVVSCRTDRSTAASGLDHLSCEGLAPWTDTLSPLLSSPRVRLGALGLAATALVLLGMTCGGGGTSSPPLAIAEPAFGASFSGSDPVTIRVRYDARATPVEAGVVRLRVRVNDEPFFDIAPAQVGSTQTQLTAQPGMLRPGRNLVTAFLPSTAPDAALNGGYLVKHRVFFVADADRDGLPDSEDPDPAGADADGDGLLDAVEAHPGGGAGGGIPGTSRNGTISIASVEPPFLVPGRAVALRGSGFEAVGQPGQVHFAGRAATGILRASPTELIVQAPGDLPEGAVDIAVADSVGLPQASAIVHASASSLPFDNLVLVSSIFAQQFFDGAGALSPSRAGNAQLFRNMLQFGSATRVLIDASRISLDAQGLVTPDLELMLELHDGVDATTRLAGNLSSNVLQDVDLLVLLLTNVVAPYGIAELDSIEDWVRVPGHRLVVVSSSIDAGSNLVANQVLQQIGARSRFDTSFPSASEQLAVEYLTPVAGFFSVPPFTNQVDHVSYLVPTAIVPGAGASIISQVGICLNSEIPLGCLGADGIHDVLQACEDAETGAVRAAMHADYVVSEPVPTQAPSVRITRVAAGQSLAGAVDVMGHGFAELGANPFHLTVEAQVEGLAATHVFFRVLGREAMVALAPGQTTAVATLGLVAPSAFPAGVHVEATGPGSVVADAAIVALADQQVKTRFTVFADADGTPAVDPGVLRRAQRQAGLELQAMCRGAREPVTGALLPPLGGGLAFEDQIDIQAVQLPQGALPLVAYDETQTELSDMAIDLALGNNPNGSPNAAIPKPSTSGAAGPVPIRAFVVDRFQRGEFAADGTLVRVHEIPQDTEAGTSQFAEAFFGSKIVKDFVLMQARDGDLEGDSLQQARPVASSLAHELVHVAAGIQDNANEVAVINGQPLDLPTPAQPSVMNSFPFFRSLRIGSGTFVRDCDEGFLGAGAAGDDAMCARMLGGYTCAASSFFDFTE